MNKKDAIVEQLKKQFILPLFYYKDESVCLEVIKTLYDTGIRMIEFTNRGDNALKIFASLTNYRNHHLPELILGAGTIRTTEHAQNFIWAGADFLISPIFNNEILETCEAKRKLWIPGCMTPTEIDAAEKSGCSIVKIFPGNVLGAKYITAIQDIFPNVKLIVTGGVEPEVSNLSHWHKAGTYAVGIGSKLISKEILQIRDYQKLNEAAKKLLEIVELL
jgi:2-dehydro-3-deoxyphosphogluconate aldolase/(4S)-4-hydroxy-2-oxoglutarate aldolase